MKKFLNYVFYRSSKFYKDWGERRIYYISGSGIVACSIANNILTIISLCFFIVKQKYGVPMVVTVYVLSYFICYIVFKEEIYIGLEKKYKEEKKQKLKGWLVVAYFVGSFILYFASLVLMCPPEWLGTGTIRLEI